MKQIIQDPNYDIIIECDYTTVEKPDQFGDVNASLKVKHVTQYQRMFNEHGQENGTHKQVFSREFIIRLYNSLVELESKPATKVNKSLVDDGLPF